MPYAIVEDVAASWDSYVRSAPDPEQLRGAGLIVHAAGRTDEGVRIVEVWESEEAWRRFAAATRRSGVDALADAARHLREFRPTLLVVPGDMPASRTREAHHA
jgi:hypothetical protein